MHDPDSADSTRIECLAGRTEAYCGAPPSSIFRPLSIRRGDPQTLHLAVEMSALETERGSRLCHVPAIFLQFAQNELSLVGAARFMQRRVGMLRALCDAAEKLWGQVVRLYSRLRANDN